MRWHRVSGCRWQSEAGHIVLKYRMFNCYKFLLYAPGQPLEYGDFSTHETLTAAKRAAI